MWKVGSEFISGNGAVGQEQLYLIDEWFGKEIEVFAYVIDDLGNYHSEEIGSGQYVLGHAPTISEIPNFIFNEGEAEMSTLLIGFRILTLATVIGISIA